MSKPHPCATRCPIHALGVTLSLALLAASPSWAAESKSSDSKSSEKAPAAPTPATTRTGFFSRSKPVEPTPEKAPEKATEKTPAKAADKPSEKSPDKPVQKTAEPNPTTASTSAKKPSTQTTSTSSKPAAKGPAANEDDLFTQTRQQASEDSKVAELRAKADEAKSKEAANLATKAYLKSLYSKMRTLEPLLKARIDLTEAAALKALESEK